MILNGKAKEDFWKWYLSEPILKFNKLFTTHKLSGENVIRVNFLAMSETRQNALIIEWFDSVGIYIETGGIDYQGLHWWYNIQQDNTINGMNGDRFKTRHEATTKAIEKANEIYNSL